VAAQTVSYPLDTLRRRMQVNTNSRIIFRGRQGSSTTAAAAAAAATVATSTNPSSSSGGSGGSTISSTSSSSSSGVSQVPTGSSSSSGMGGTSSSRMMSSSGSSSSGSSSSGRAPQPVPFKGYIGCLRHMMQHEGGLIRPLFRGWLVNCCKTVPGAALQFVAYDLLKVGVTYIDPASGAMSPL
jgi:hypothetical protein